jgi:hypothetical protein
MWSLLFLHILCVNSILQDTRSSAILHISRARMQDCIGPMCVDLWFVEERMKHLW